MSADSPSHSRPEQTSTMQNTVTPQPVTDPTILDSVAGFINEVVPTANNDFFDTKDQIQWARFENLDWDESNHSLNTETPIPSSLILVLGYTTGIQVWAIPANGEALELFSWRHGSIKVLRILPAPYEVGTVNKRDQFESKRPLIALVDVATHGSSAGSLNFYSLKTGEQVKQIKFKNQILDVLANRRSVIITFPEKIAVFDAFTLEDKLSVTACYLSPGIQQNPVALAPRWLAFAEKKLVASRRSSGGNEGEGVQSYTATVLHAAKSLGRGLRELGDAVASSLTGNQMSKLGTSPNSPQAGGSSDVPQKGIITILDLESSLTQNADGSLHSEAIVAHFVAHTEAIVWLQFGPCGMLLLTADKRGHDFNLFRINPHPLGSALAAIHHLYTLHRGDTSARVQDMCFSFDSRWVTVSTLRGTTHIFPITPYGGNIGVRTHTTPHVVNKMSRFHRSAGLTAEGRSNSPVSMYESPVSSNFPYHNPRFAPFPHPTVVNPLAQLRQPVYMQNVGTTTPRQGRQRLSSSSEDYIALRITACFAPARAWIDTIPMQRETPLNKTVKSVDSLFIMNCHGTLVQYDLEPHYASHIPKERVCDDTQIELTVTAKAQWRLQRQSISIDRPLPIPQQSLIYVGSIVPTMKKKVENGNDDDWLSQVEIITHAGPHRRLWMGPQFTFKTYTTTNGTPMSLADAQPLDLNRSKPVNMPITKANAILIESSSASSSEQSLLDIYRKNCEELGAAGEHQIKEDLADAMMESPGGREAGGRCVIVSMKPQSTRRPIAAPSPIAKVVNPLGTVVTVQSDDESDVNIPEDIVIYENCDEALFRPLVSPKALAYCKSSKAHSGNIMTQSLRADTEVTVRVLDKSREHIGHPSSWEDPKIEDIKGDMKVIVRAGEVTDIMVPKDTNDAPVDNIERSKGKIKTKGQSNGRKNQNSPPKGLVGSSSSKPSEINVQKFESKEKKISDNNQTEKLKCEQTHNINTRVEQNKNVPNTYLTDTIEKAESKSKVKSNYSEIKLVESSQNTTPKNVELIRTDQTATQERSKEENVQLIATSMIQGVQSSKNIVSRKSVECEPAKKDNNSTNKSNDKSKLEQFDAMKKSEDDSRSSSEQEQDLRSENKTFGPLKVSKSKSKKKDHSLKYAANVENSKQTTFPESSSEVCADYTVTARKSKKEESVDSETILANTNSDIQFGSSKKHSKSVDVIPSKITAEQEELEIKYKSHCSSVSKVSEKTEDDCKYSNKNYMKDTSLTSSNILLKDLDITETISFPALDEKLVNPDFPPLDDNFFSLENISKGDKFEDAQDCGLPLEPVEKSLQNRNLMKTLEMNTSDVVSLDTVSTSEDNIEEQKKEKLKKKVRKVKTKLGVKITSSSKEASPEPCFNKESAVEKSSSDVSAEITLPAPKKSWSSIVAKPQKPQQEVTQCLADNNRDEPVKHDQIESYTITLPKKSYSSVITEKLLDIETPEERHDYPDAITGDFLDIDKFDESSKNEESKKVSHDLLKLSDKSSDDEKNDSGSTPVDTTESSDEGKVAETIISGENKIIAPGRPSGKSKVKKRKK